MKKENNTTQALKHKKEMAKLYKALKDATSEENITKFKEKIEALKAKAEAGAVVNEESAVRRCKEALYEELVNYLKIGLKRKKGEVLAKVKRVEDLVLGRGPFNTEDSSSYSKEFSHYKILRQNVTEKASVARDHLNIRMSSKAECAPASKGGGGGGSKYEASPSKAVGGCSGVFETVYYHSKAYPELNKSKMVRAHVYPSNLALGNVFRRILETPNDKKEFGDLILKVAAAYAKSKNIVNKENVSIGEVLRHNYPALYALSSLVRKSADEQNNFVDKIKNNKDLPIIPQVTIIAPDKVEKAVGKEGRPTLDDYEATIDFMKKSNDPHVSIDVAAYCVQYIRHAKEFINNDKNLQFFGFEKNHFSALCPKDLAEAREGLCALLEDSVYSYNVNQIEADLIFRAKIINDLQKIKSALNLDNEENQQNLINLERLINKTPVNLSGVMRRSTTDLLSRTMYFKEHFGLTGGSLVPGLVKVPAGKLQKAEKNLKEDQELKTFLPKEGKLIVLQRKIKEMLKKRYDLFIEEKIKSNHHQAIGPEFASQTRKRFSPVFFEKDTAIAAAQEAGYEESGGEALAAADVVKELRQYSKVSVVAYMTAKELINKPELSAAERYQVDILREVLRQTRKRVESKSEHTAAAEVGRGEYSGGASAADEADAVAANDVYSSKYLVSQLLFLTELDQVPKLQELLSEKITASKPRPTATGPAEKENVGYGSRGSASAAEKNVGYCSGGSASAAAASAAENENMPRQVSKSGKSCGVLLETKKPANEVVASSVKDSRNKYREGPHGQGRVNS